MIDITTTIANVTAWINTISGNNHFMAAAILTGIAIIARNVPKKIYDFIYKHLFFVVVMNDSYDQNGACRTTHALLKWHQSSRWAKFSKSITLRDQGEQLDERILTGFGTHFFFYKGVLFWMSVRATEPKSGNSSTMNVVTIRTFTWNRNLIKDILLDIYPVNFDTPPIYQSENSGGFGASLTEVGRVDKFYGEQKQMICDEQYDEIDKIVSRFVNHPEWYVENEMKYKESFLLYGEPGTGKTTLARHFSSRYNLPVIIANPYIIHQLRKTGETRKRPMIILIEDIDGAQFLCTQEALDADADNNIETIGNSRYSNRPQPLAMKGDRSTFLNYFDGVAPLDNVLIFMTTNHIEKIHPSIYRPGRVDHLFNITYPTHEKIAHILGWGLDDSRYGELLKANLRDYPLAILSQLRLAKTTEDVRKTLEKGKEYFFLEDVGGVKYVKKGKTLDAA